MNVDNHRGIVPTAFQEVGRINIHHKIMLATCRDNAPVLVRCLYTKIFNEVVEEREVYRL